MTFNINELKSRIDNYGGMSRTNLFMVELFGTNSLNSTVNDDTIRFFCKSVTVPGVNLSVKDYSARNFGMPESVPTNLTQTPLNALFMMDSDHQIITFFHEWMQNIGNYNAVDGFRSANPRNLNQLAYEFNYKEDYAVTMMIRHFSTHSSEFRQSYECLLTGVYPTEVSPPSFSWENSSEPASLSVNFSYSKIKFTGTSVGTSAPRGTSEIDYYTEIGDFSLSDQSSIDRASRIKPFSTLMNR